MNSFGMPLRSMHSETSSDHHFQSVPQCGTPSLFSLLYSLFTSPAPAGSGLRSWLAKMPYFHAHSQARNHAGAAHPCTPPISAGRQRIARRRRPCGEQFALMACGSCLTPMHAAGPVIMPGRHTPARPQSQRDAREPPAAGAPCGERLANCRRLLYDRHRISPERRA